MATGIGDHPPYYIDISTNGTYKNLLQTFSKVLEENSSDASPFFIFADRVPGVDELKDQIKKYFPGNLNGRHFIVVVKNETKKASEAYWPILEAGLHDIFEWTNEEDLINYIKSVADRNEAIEEIIDSPLIQKYLIGESRTWKNFLREVIEVAIYSNSSVLLIGESGTGKELLSRLIHTIGNKQKKKSIVLIDCTTIVPDLSGSEFFGHEKGSYTNALQTREGAFALANEGTLFLDEVGELPFALQSELLRVIQEGTYKKVGSNIWNKTSFRLVCATNKDLHASIEERKFRQDLYFRISDFELHVPSLKERWEDIPVLANHFLAECFPEGECPEFDPPVMDYLINRNYSGNVRELKQLIRRIALKHVHHKKITIGEIPINDRPQQSNGNILNDEFILTSFLRNAILSGHDLREMKSKTMEEAIKIALELTHGDKQMAAQKLGVTLRAIQQFWKKNKAELED